MSGKCCSGQGCGCQATTMYTSRRCPECGGKVRVTGNPQTIKYRLSCSGCGYQSHELSIEEFAEIIDE